MVTEGEIELVRRVDNYTEREWNIIMFSVLLLLMYYLTIIK